MVSGLSVNYCMCILTCNTLFAICFNSKAHSGVHCLFHTHRHVVLGGMHCCLCLFSIHIRLFQLMEGRKAVGGKLEVKIRIRDPYVTKQVEEVKEKWLVIDHFERHLPPAAAAEVN